MMEQASGNDYFFHYDRRFNVVALSSGAGNIVERYAYSGYGETTIFNGAGTSTRSVSSYGNEYTFTGRRLDEDTGLHYFRARYYSSDHGRFYGRDPLGYVDGASLYGSYFGVDDVDPSGLDVEGPYSHGNLEYYKVETTTWFFFFGGKHLGNVVYDPNSTPSDDAYQVALARYNKGDKFDVLVISHAEPSTTNFWDTGIGNFFELLGAKRNGFSPEMQAMIDKGRSLREEFGINRKLGSRDVRFYNEFKKIPFIGPFSRITYGEIVAEGETKVGASLLVRDVAEAIAYGTVGGLAAKLIPKSWQKLSKSRVKQLEKLMKKDGTDIHRYKGKGGGGKTSLWTKKNR